MQRLADARAAVDDVAEEQRHPLRVLPDVAPLAVTQALEQALEGMRTTVDIAYQVVAAARIEAHQSPPPSRLPQPSLVRQTS
ncbi:hypothetical protein D3C80_2063340 [compost metagenome]